MEPHHLVPMCESEKFTVSLDREENIICLCSNCHNEIHYGKRAKEIVAIFYEQRKDLLKSVGIDISLADLLKIY
jgi:predicted HNH restriction endonuclease